ncbi:MAG: glycine cleavage system protein T, partial [Actinomyces sp.]
TADGTPAVVRTAVRSPRLGRVIGLALVPVPVAEPGTILTVTTPAGDTTAVVSDVPFGTPWPS